MNPEFSKKIPYEGVHIEDLIKTLRNYGCQNAESVATGLLLKEEYLILRKLNDGTIKQSK